MMGKSENPLLKPDSNNFSKRLKSATYWILWATAMSLIIGAAAGSILWMILIYGVYDPR